MQDPVQGQLEAYNNRDVDSFVKYFSKDVEVFRYPSLVEPVLVGYEAFYDRYKTLFAENPNLHCHIVHRTKMGDYVFDEELIEGVVARETPLHAMAIYYVQDGLIQKIWFVREN